METLDNRYIDSEVSHQASNFIPQEDHAAIIDALKNRYETKLVTGHFVVHTINNSNQKITEGLESNVHDVVALEVNTLCTYLKKTGLIFRTTIYAGYTILAKVLVL